MLRKIAALVQRHPVTWRGAWSLVHQLPFLLPHDASYRGIRHLGLPADGLLLDVGANDGISALSFRRLLPDNPVLSVEISPRHEPRLLAMKQRMPKFDYVLVGAGEKRDTLRLFTPVYRGILLHTFAGGDRDNVRHALIVAFGQTIADRCVMFEDNAVLQPLDELNISPAFVKIDVEGMGNAVLRGLRQTLERSRPALMIEVEPDEIEEMLGFLAALGYKPMVYDVTSDELQRFRNVREFFGASNKNLYFVQG
jgi:FkbM family methyltransferase